MVLSPGRFPAPRPSLARWIPALLFASLLPASADVNNDLAQACRRGDLGAATQALNQGANVNTVENQTPVLFEAAKGPNSEALVNLLLAHQANVNVRDRTGATPLHAACDKDHAVAALALLQAGADPNIGNMRDRFPLTRAANHDDAVLVQALLDHHADPHGGTAMVWAIKGQPNILEPARLAVVQILLQSEENPPWVIPPDPKNPPYTEELTAAVDYRLATVADLLLDHHADPNALNHSGVSAFEEAAQWGRSKMVKLLLDRHASLTATDSRGRTAFMLAALRGQMDVVNFLLLQGVDLNVHDPQGETALTYAGNGCHAAIVDLLKSKGATRTDLHIFPGEKAVVPLTPAQAWGLSVGAIYAQVHGENHNDLGGLILFQQSLGSAKLDLVHNWDIHNETDLLKTLDDLLNSGMHRRDVEEGKKLAEMPAAASGLMKVLSYVNGLPNTDDLKRRDYEKWKGRDGLALDLAVYVHLVNFGVACHYLQPNDAWDLIHDAAVKLQQNFSSWQEVADNFLDGRELAHGYRDPDYDLAVQLLTNPSDPNSPWNQTPWKTPLTP